jgi:hypothetical protein
MVGLYGVVQRCNCFEWLTVQHWSLDGHAPTQASGQNETAIQSTLESWV